MPRFATRATLAVTLLGVAACTQPAATVQLEGHKYFAQSGTREKSYAAYMPGSGRYQTPSKYTAPISMGTTQAAGVDSISVSDLSAPAPTSVRVSEAAPVKAVAAPAVKQEAKADDIQKINPWTKKPRNEIIEAHAKPEQPAPIKISAVEKPAAPAKTKPVKLSSDKTVQSFIWPVNGSKIISAYGPKGGGKVNDGINIAAASGEPVWAAGDGEIVYVGNELQGYGNMVLVKHASGKTTTYAHLSQITVDKYDRVAQGDIIGYVGTSGNVKKPQLHFAVRDGKDFVDPTKYVRRNLASN